MRTKIHVAPKFRFELGEAQLAVYGEFQRKYERISEMLDSNPGILDAVHEDLAGLGSDGGRDSDFSSEQLFRALLVKQIEGESYRGTVVRLSDSPVLRNFTRIFSDDVMNYTILCSAGKMISPRTWEMVNASLRDYAVGQKKVTGQRLRVDSTVCETDIHYPTDSSLLWDVYRTGTRLIRLIIEENQEFGMGNRFHVEKIKQLHTFIATHRSKKSRSTKRKVRRTEAVLIERTEQHVAVCKDFVKNTRRQSLSIRALGLVVQLEEMIPLFEQVVTQARRAHAGEKVPASERIFSIFEPHTELLMRGKAHKPVEFGHMVTIGQSAEKFITYYNVEERSRHDIDIGDEALNAHKRIFGDFPKEFSGDKNYYGGPEHLANWEEKVGVYSVGKKGKRTQEQVEREHGFLFRLLQKFRAGCEGTISVLKRVFGLRRCLNEGFRSFASSIGSIVFCHNLVLLARI